MTDFREGAKLLAALVARRVPEITAMIDGIADDAEPLPADGAEGGAAVYRIAHYARAARLSLEKIERAARAALVE